jgi:hypothetical protein
MNLPKNKRMILGAQVKKRLAPEAWKLFVLKWFFVCCVANAYLEIPRCKRGIVRGKK